MAVHLSYKVCISQERHLICRRRRQTSAQMLAAEIKVIGEACIDLFLHSFAQARANEVRAVAISLAFHVMWILKILLR